jgi:hypothetical protein
MTIVLLESKILMAIVNSPIGGWLKHFSNINSSFRYQACQNESYKNSFGSI